MPGATTARGIVEREGGGSSAADEYRERVRQRALARERALQRAERHAAPPGADPSDVSAQVAPTPTTLFKRPPHSLLLAPAATVQVRPKELSKTSQKMAIAEKKAPAVAATLHVDEHAHAAEDRSATGAGQPGSSAQHAEMRAADTVADTFLPDEPPGPATIWPDLVPPPVETRSPGDAAGAGPSKAADAEAMKALAARKSAAAQSREKTLARPPPPKTSAYECHPSKADPRFKSAKRVEREFTRV